MVGDPAQGRGVETRWSFWSFSTQAILWFYDSLNSCHQIAIYLLIVAHLIMTLPFFFSRVYFRIWGSAERGWQVPVPLNVEILTWTPVQLVLWTYFLMLNLMVHLLSFFWLSFFLLIQPSPETTSGYLPDIWELMQQSQELFQQLILSRAYFYCSPVHFFLLTNAFRKRYPGSKPT